MRLIFNTSFEDLMAFQKYYLESVGFFWQVKFYNLFMFFVGIVFFMFYDFSGFSIDVTRIILFLVVFVVFTTYFLLTFEGRTLRKIKHAFQENRENTFLGSTQMDFNRYGVEIRNKGILVELHWNEIIKFRENDEYIFLFASEMSAYIIPKKKVANKQILEVEKLLETKLKDE